MDTSQFLIFFNPQFLTVYLDFSNFFAEIHQVSSIFVDKILNALAIIKQAFAVFVDDGLEVTDIFGNITYVSFNSVQDDATSFDID